MINGELQCIPGIWSASDKPGVPLGATDSKTGSEIFFYQIRRCIGVDKKPSMGCLTCFFGEGFIRTKCRCKTPDHSGFFNSSAELEILSSGKNVNRFYSVNFRTFAIIKSYQNT
jgi:hypothetical protein